MSDTWRLNAIVLAILIIADKKIALAGYDKTRKGIISLVIDKTSGKYKIKYQDSLFLAYATSSNVYYDEGQPVSFLVPGNDWSREITILSGVKNYATNYTEVPLVSLLYNKTGPSAINLVNNENTIFGLCSYKIEEKSLIEKGFLSINQLIGKEYIPRGNGLVIGMDVQTSLDSSQVNGNYGLRFDLIFRNILTGSLSTTKTIKVVVDGLEQDLIVDFPFSLGGAAVRSYFVTDRDVIGNPYGLTKTTAVEHLLNIDDINPADFIGIKDIVAYCNGFPLDDGDYDNDIFFSNIHINGVNVLSELDLTGYVVHIDYSETGQIIEKVPLVLEGELPEILTVKLLASLKVNGKKVTSEDLLSYYWFRLNGLIFRNSDTYSSYGGDGWECLNNFANGKPIPATNTIYFTSSSTRLNVPLTIPSNEYNTRVKCVIVYKYKETSGFLNVINKNIRNFYIDNNLKQSGNNTNKVDYYLDYGMPTLTCLPLDYNPEEDEISDYTFTWSVVPARGQGIEIKLIDNNRYKDIKDAENNYLTIQKEIKKVPKADLNNYKDAVNYDTKIKAYEEIKNFSYVKENVYYNFPISSIINYSRVICTVKRGEVYQGSASITLYNHTQVPNTYSLNIENSTQVFQYDGKGNSPTSPQLEKPLLIKPLSFTLIDDEGNLVSYLQIINNGYVEWIIPTLNTLLISDNDKNGSPLDDALLIGTDKALAASLGYEVNIYKRPSKEEGQISNLASFVYKIADTYDSKKVNNNIRLDVKYKDMLFTAYTDFTFPKDGDPGTNGTDFVAKLVPDGDINTDRLYVDSQGNRYTDNGNSFDKLKFLLYNNSNVVDNKVDFWTCPPKTTFDSSHSDINTAKHYINVDNTGKITKNNISYDVLADKAVNIIRAQNGTSNNIKYFALYPICFSYLNNTNYRFKVRPKTGFKYVVYALDGTSPDYDKTLPFEIVVEEYKGYYIEVDNGLNYTWNIVTGSYLLVDKKLNENSKINITLGTSTSSNKCYFKPKDKFVSTDLFSAIVVTIKKGTTQLGWIHIPIYMIINRYGHSALNSWDGTSIQMKLGGDTILAPQVGAGTKNSNNQFNGILIGDVKSGNSNQQGLFGYNQGLRSIFLDAENGNATFGKQGAGQIKIDATTNLGTISSGDYNYTTANHTGTGMKIKFSSTGSGTEQGPYIRFGSNKFSVSSDGSIHAAGSGDIAGWTINDDKIYKGNTGMSSQVTKVSDIDPSKSRPRQSDTVAFYAGQTTESGDTEASPNFYVTHKGYLFSKSGRIAKWDIDENALTNNNVGMGQGKTIPADTFNDQSSAITNARIWSGTDDTTTFAVTANGKLYSKSGQIASWTIEKTNLTNGKVGLGSHSIDKERFSTSNDITARIWAGTDGELNFAVTNGGSIYSRSGKIGGWTITNTNLSANGININSTGTIQSTYSSDNETGYSIKGNGNAVFYNIDANKGTIGKCTIDKNGIGADNGETGDKNKNWSIKNDGTASFNSITASGGEIGGMTITETQVSGRGWYISNNKAHFNGLQVDSNGVSSGGSGITGGSGSGAYTLGSSAATFDPSGTLTGINNKEKNTYEKYMNWTVNDLVVKGKFTVDDWESSWSGINIPSNLNVTVTGQTVEIPTYSGVNLSGVSAPAGGGALTGSASLISGTSKKAISQIKVSVKGGNAHQVFTCLGNGNTTIDLTGDNDSYTAS